MWIRDRIGTTTNRDNKYQKDEKPEEKFSKNINETYTH